MGEGKPSPVFEDIFSKCLLCGACVAACPRGVDIPGEVRRARTGFRTFYGEHGYRKFLARKVLENPELLGVARRFGGTFARLLAEKLPEESGLRLQLAIFDSGAAPDSTRVPAAAPVPAGKNSLVYFPGCSGSYLYPEIIESCRTIFRSIGHELVIPEGLVCCGLAMDAAGDTTRSRELARRNILALERHEGSIMVSCGSCYAHLRRYAEVLADDPAWSDRVEYVTGRLVEMSRLLDESLPAEAGQEANSRQSAGQKIKVFYHDPCHLRHGQQITREPRNVLRRFSQVQLLELADGPQCCGQGGLFHLGAPELSALIRDDLVGKVLELEPDVITSSCSGCLMQWKTAIAAAGRKTPVLHLAELLVRLQKRQPVN